MGKQQKKLHINITDRTDAQLADLEEYLDTNRTDAVRRSVALAALIARALTDGKQLILRNGNGELEVLHLLPGGHL
jgi:hypothetical protein